jgi:hypothetical protein
MVLLSAQGMDVAGIFPAALRALAGRPPPDETCHGSAIRAQVRPPGAAG